MRTKFLTQTSKEMVEAFKVAGVSGASKVLDPHRAFSEPLREMLTGKIPEIFLERIFYKKVSKR